MSTDTITAAAGDSATTPARREAAERIGASFKGAMAAVRRLRGRQTRHPEALSHAQYGLLFGLCNQPQLSSRELAVSADLSPATVTEMLDGLANHGLVTRERSELDRRVVLVSLTERGREVVEQRRGEYEGRWLAAMAEFSDEELLRTAAVLDRLREMFDSFGEDR